MTRRMPRRFWTAIQTRIFLSVLKSGKTSFTLRELDADVKNLSAHLHSMAKAGFLEILKKGSSGGLEKDPTVFAIANGITEEYDSLTKRINQAN